MKKKIFITGGTGFVGGHLLKQAGMSWEVSASYRKKRFAFPNVKWIQLDLTDFSKSAALIQSLRPDVIIHAAATANLDQAEELKDAAFLNNVRVTEHLAGLCEKEHIRFIFISTDMVFDGLRARYQETDVPAPVNYYGQTKSQAEAVVKSICSNYVIVRSALVYGNSLTESPSFSEWMLAHWRQRKPVRLFTDQYRTPILVNNLSQALLELASNSFQGVIHLGGPQRINRFNFGLVFAKLYGIPSHLIIPTSMKNLNFKALRPVDTSFNTSLAKNVLVTELMDCYRGVQYLKRDSAF